ncbi:MAG: site-specific integrase [Marmoricola sp.]
MTGPLAHHAEGFKVDLANRGYRSGSASNQLLRMAQLSGWLASRQLNASDLTAQGIGEFLTERREAGYSTWLSPVGLSQLLGYLREIGAAPLAAPPVPVAPIDVLMRRYADYLAHERGLAAASVMDYVRAAKVFLASRSVGGELDPGAPTSTDVTQYLLMECQGTAAHAKRVASRLRSLLRFLFVEGITETALVAGVPAAANRPSSLPKAISASQVSRLLRSCDRRTSVGRRDFAILTVLVRLGLRAGEVAGLRLQGIDWRAGEMIVRGKGGRIARLPLPVDVGEAIVAWLRRGRPRGDCPYLFTRIRAPRGGLSVAGVSMVVARAGQRAGMPPMRAHRLRHTAATELLRAGGSLAEVAQVMRHEHDGTTSLYAKVDRAALSAVIRPWPGSAP